MLCLSGPRGATHAQNKGVLTGQNVAPVFEGWQREADGGISMWFGYFNRNFEEVVDVPIGPDNGMDPGPDRGQPTHFLPRRQKFLFKVPLPADWPKERRLVWTLTVHGKTDKAQGWLQPEWEVDDGVIQMNMGPGGAPPDPPNRRPTMTGSPSQQATAGHPVTLIASANDDGSPKPRTGNRARGPAKGVTIRWVQYRGPGQVIFSVPVATGEYGRSLESSTKATFSAPGAYVVWAIASDGLLETSHAVAVTVR
jgi:hypothetical protein